MSLPTVKEKLLLITVSVLLVIHGLGFGDVRTVTGRAADKRHVIVAQADSCEGGDGQFLLSAEVAGVTYREEDTGEPAPCQTDVPPGDAVAMSAGGSVEVDDGGRARVKREPDLGILLFGDSALTIERDATDDGLSNPLLALREGSARVDVRPDVSTELGLAAALAGGVTLRTEDAIITSTLATFFLYYGSGGITWVVVSRGIVHVTAAGETVTVHDGWQTWVTPENEPRPPLPATRSVVDADISRDLPAIAALTDDRLANDDVFATCRVSPSAGLDLFFGPATEYGVRSQVQRGMEFDAAYRASSEPWLFGTTESGEPGWIDATGLRCPYDTRQLPLAQDGDDDAFPDAADNCPGVYNPDQRDADGDNLGDACDAAPTPTPGGGNTDVDGDGYADEFDNCADIFNPGQDDWDFDNVGDACDEEPDDPDMDSDGFPDTIDNCVEMFNPGQDDSDFDDIGDACDGEPTPVTSERDSDIDGDGYADEIDNCADTFNPGQDDSDFDNVGDACDVEATPPAQ